MKNHLMAIIALFSVGMSGCGTIGVGGGKEGVFVDDFLPERTVIYRGVLKSKKTKIIPGSETGQKADIVFDMPLEERFECSWLEFIIFDDSTIPSTAWGGLRNHQYGGKYMPTPPGRARAKWITSAVRIYPISRGSAKSIADGCGIDFRVKK